MSDPTSASKSHSPIQQNKVIDAQNTDDLLSAGKSPQLSTRGLGSLPLTPAHIVQLQRHIGNTATRQLINREGEAQTTKPSALPADMKSEIETLSGVSLDDVRVHYNSPVPAQLNAHAYAQGTDIHVAPGQEKHLPHEAWHVVQQKQGRVKATKQL